MGKIKVKKLVLLPYAAADVHQDTPGGEAAYLYEKVFNSADVYQIVSTGLAGRLFVKDNIGLYILGEGKINAAMNASSLLSNSSFDFSSTQFILYGCCGSAKDIGVPGDVYVVTATADMELGHCADGRDLELSDGPSWFPNKTFEYFSNYKLNQSLTDSLYELIKDSKTETTQNTIDFMDKTFNGESWAVRNPKVMRASSVTSDSYWKGHYKHKDAQHIIEYYGFDDPYIVTDMEDSAVTRVMEVFGCLDRFLIIRYSVNMDVFMCGETPESMWGDGDSVLAELGFDNFSGLFPVASRCASSILLKVLSDF